MVHLYKIRKTIIIIIILNVIIIFILKKKNYSLNFLIQKKILSNHKIN